MLKKLWMLSLLVSHAAFAAPFQIGDTTIQVNISGSPGRFTYVHVHENESTALKAAQIVQKHRGGKLIHLAHGGGRMVNFSLKGQSYSFDPNRIFTPNGLQKTLAMNSVHRVTPEVTQEVKKLADFITNQLQGGTVVAVHNNKSNPILRYLPNGPYAKSTSDTVLVGKLSPHHFYIVTQRSMFESLKGQGFNVVLQDNRRVEDDGSLSVYAARHGLPYINVEAGFGALTEQVKMLNAIP